MRKLLAITAAFLFAAALPSRAASVVFLLNTPNGDMGTSNTFNRNGVRIVAYSDSISGNFQPDLYGKNGGTNETGLGLTHDVDHEINSSDFVQMDFADPLTLHVQEVQFEMGSVQAGEGWSLYGSHTSGVLGTDLLDSTINGQLVSLPDWGVYRYYSWTATAGNVVLGEIVVTTGGVQTTAGAPEPQNMAATGAALIGLGLMIRRLRRLP
jgi:hypothetical protein